MNKIIIKIDNYFIIYDMFVIQMHYLCNNKLSPNPSTHMKKLLRLSLFCALGLGLGFATSCDTGGEEPIPTLDTPTGLAQTDITPTSANFTWNEVTDATSYFVRINGGTPISTPTNSYAATGLEADTNFNWAVQAVNSEATSDWSANSSFRTLVIPIDVPTALTASEVTHHSAVLSWTGTDSALSYELRIDGGTPFYHSETTYTVQYLAPETEYTWEVRAVTIRGDSAWVPATFTTEPDVERLEFVWGDIALYYGDLYGPDSRNFALYFQDADVVDPEWNGNVIELDLDVISPVIDDGPTVQFLEIPSGTYVVDGSNDILTIDPRYSALLMVVAEEVEEDLGLVSGFMMVSGNPENYRMTFDMELSNGEMFYAVYEGPLVIPNPDYVEPMPPFEDDVDMGTLPMQGELLYVSDPFDEPTVDAYLTEGFSPEVQLVMDTPTSGHYEGTGWIIGDIQFHAELGAGPIIPDGEYEIADSNDPGYVLAGFVNPNNNALVGLWARWIEDDDVINIAPVLSGTVTSAYVEGVYTITVDGVDNAGHSIKAIVTGTGEEDSEPAGAAARPYKFRNYNNTGATAKTAIRRDTTKAQRVISRAK
jgi:hypothetical protein